MDLYVLRHGLAGTRGSPEYPNDDERPLTSRGVRRMIRQTRGLRSIGLSVDVIITSPLTRAAQTAEIVHQGLDESIRLTVSEALAPTGDPAALMAQLAMDRPSVDRVMIVGHEPYLSGLISVLATGGTEPVIRLKKGALCKLRVPIPKHGRCGWIEWFLTPKQMIRLG